MAANVSVIGRTTRVRGRVTGAVDLEVQGFVDGEIAVGGDVTVDTHGMVGAGVRGRRLVVRGAVKGDLHGEEAVLLEEGARVVGDVRAPRVSIAPGALVRGYVETGESDGAPARAPRTQSAARPAAAPARPAPAVAKAAPPAPPSKTAAKASAPAHHAGASTGNSGPRRPPPPVVPALKKAKGQIAKKKER
ncbi:MAG TPA: polymer-forming cytoskeletal protein [Polyangiaceae bacterium]|jgi:cytoskeletal protein CcmA (bactofilin family)